METLDTREAAELLKLSPGETLRLARAGEFPGINWGNKWTFLRVHLLEWMDRRAKEQQRERLGQQLETQARESEEPKPKGRPRRQPLAV